tara:strand:+ start:662 stop:901 length:240 start_codon:yes stop_codon:yes gene_type:complete
MFKIKVMIMGIIGFILVLSIGAYAVFWGLALVYINYKFERRQNPSVLIVSIVGLVVIYAACINAPFEFAITASWEIINN